MKYYQISHSSEPKVIGVKNGIYQFEIDYNNLTKDIESQSFLDFFDYSNKDFWSDQERIKNFKIPVIKGEMLKKATVTDIMGYAPIISYLNEAFSYKYVSILKEYNIDNYGTFKIEIQDVLERYYLLFNKTICLDEIDYKESTLVTGHAMMDNLKYYKVENEFEYIEFKQKNPLGKFDKISISKEFFGKDIICIQPLANPFYSEKLINGLINEGITGLEIKYENSTKLSFV
ncbi:hypothetical protein BC749_12420 [Flavobacterium araucananum]|uniref:Uncharacterized protein n=1 Tax=Flavobacterium araucananum TaxID=946678 RepID=A0A227NQQ2_9FLAO|nr:hypothetical protein [Flavobacterium araucananum]OXE99607.1 hypothetical protein B0A64_21115 [Flavobacterium araucananum]PWJ89273.1 hypothetical protein BC749_12420 [Flavobacterium araucananum]